eukprot:10369913-Alexandrium_andersonii.AAC.1
MSGGPFAWLLLPSVRRRQPALAPCYLRPSRPRLALRGALPCFRSLMASALRAWRSTWCYAPWTGRKPCERL